MSDVRNVTPGLLGRLATVSFFVGPAVIVALAIGARTTRAIESYEAVMGRVAVHATAARAAAQDEGVETNLVLAVACAESGGRADARSSAGAVGLMQLMPSTAAELARGESSPELTDPATSLRLGARYLRRQLDRFADTACAKELAVAAYNAGPEKVQEWVRSGPPPTPETVVDRLGYAETRGFVRRVLDYEERWKARGSTGAPR